jgi:hypothetical protein
MAHGGIITSFGSKTLHSTTPMSRGHGGYASQNACATLAKAEKLTHDSAHFFVSHVS